ncbi:LysR family transcriptional regulator [Caballeronia arvi]|uniref:LysR family transcriptional regulator n=1 Tax=Caballeronia arvi TaxID=1777135 RepID=A0A158KSK7_9BURK|nr:LysR family transcriptional regulator [Caballeronia arvi]
MHVEPVLGPIAELLGKPKRSEIDAELMGLPDAEPRIESIPPFEDDISFAAPTGSPYANQEAVDLRAAATKRSFRSARNSRRITASWKRFASRTSRQTSRCAPVTFSG